MHPLSDSQHMWAQLRQKRDSLKFRLVTTELDLAITFLVIAATTDDQAKFHRNIAYAEQAYATAIHFLTCNLEVGQNLEIEAKLARLNSLRAVCPPNGLFQLSSRLTLRDT